MGRIGEAREQYKLALETYNESTKIGEWDAINKVLLLVLLQEKEAAQIELNQNKNIISQTEYKYTQKMIDEFNREEFINNALK